MPCFRPISGFRSRSKNDKSGKYPLVFSKNRGYSDLEVRVNCGRCIGCRLEHSRQWAVRCMHEAQLHNDNCFITLTYDGDNLPSDGSLNVRHFQLFMKRLRKHFSDKIVRFYHCGEYGDTFRRPHYHACLFGIDFSDKTLFKSGEYNLYVSDTLTDLWGLGFCTIGELTFDSAAYVARYVVKKFKSSSDEAKRHHYSVVDKTTGEINFLKPEYVTMSRRPGIAADFVRKYQSDIYAYDSVIANGVRMRPPRFYDTLFEQQFPDAFTLIKSARLNPDDKTKRRRSFENSSDRLAVREECSERRASLLSRSTDFQL